ncbi:unnamed protein product [Calicophoron daubneyi]|uniref:Uncharacterized protein n=1 Tax=Calicophoron daubneyi TaxID=300641 RepID=A0AAV2TYF3_CALDB
MSFAAVLKKKIAKSNQYIAEKISKDNRQIDTGEEYKRLSSLIDAYKHYYEEVRKKSLECLEPGPNVVNRLRPINATAGSHNNPVKEIYPHAELMLGKCFEKYANVFDAFKPFGGALSTAAESYLQLADAKVRAVDETKGGFTGPISETLNQDIKEIIMLRKKCESRRLAYEVERKQVEKSRAMITTPEYVEAQKKFEQSLADSTSAMSNFLDTEAEQIETLCNLVNAQLSYYQDAARILQDLKDRLQSHREDAANKLSSTLEQQNFIEATQPDENASPKVEVKPKYEGQLQQTPVCKAMFDFEAENPFELSFHEGDLLKLIEQVDENWFLGELNGKQGHFPTTYVQVLVPLPA